MSGKERTVSVVIPCYNGAQFLGAAIDSALQQTHPPLEIIVVDDGSTDDSAAIALTYGPPVRVIRQTNQGESAARNAGLGVARGCYVAFLDCDDLCKPERLERQWSALRDNADAVACFTGYWLFNHAGWLRDCPANIAAGRRDPIEYFSNVLFLGATAFYDRERAPDVRFPVGIRAGEDLIFSAQLATCGALIGIPDVLYGYRVHETQNSRQNRVTATSNRYFEERYNWVKAHWSQHWPGKTWEEIEATLWQGVVRQTEDAYWARHRDFFIHDRNYIRTHWPSYLPTPAVRDWRWYPDWVWEIKAWIDRAIRSNRPLEAERRSTNAR